MRLKKSKEPKKYAVGGFVAAGALGALQSALGAGQIFAGQSAASRIKEASTARPSEYAELLKQARNADLETRRIEELNRAIGTGIAAAQGAGGRAVVGVLPQMLRAADVGAIDILGQRRSDTMQALQFGALGAEKEIGRELGREMMERGAAQAAIEGGLQNIAGGLGQAGSAAIYGQMEKNKMGKDFGGVEAASVEPKGLADLGLQEPAPGRIMRQLPPFQLTELDEELMGRTKSSYLKEGGMVTGGKFDHKTNPIDIVQQGRKVGEMTGGEVILNPAQQKKLSKESAYFRTLLKKFNKQK